MDTYRLILFVHVAAALVLVASSVVFPHVRSAIQRAQTKLEIRRWASFAEDAARINPVAALLVLASGVYLASGRWSETWVQVSVGVFLASALLANMAVKAACTRLLAHAAADEEERIDGTLDALRTSARLEVGADLLAAMDAAAVFLMTAQPAGAGAVLTPVIAGAVALLSRLFLRRSRAHAAPVAPSA